MAILTPAQYAEQRGKVCPVCGGTIEIPDVIYPESKHYIPGGLFYYVVCPHCHSLWNKRYRIIGYEDISVGEKMQMFGLVAPVKSEHYAADGAVYCPACGKSELRGGRFVEEWVDGQIKLVMWCGYCKTQWTDIYGVQGYDELLTHP